MHFTFFSEENEDIGIKQEELRKIASLHKEDKNLFEEIENILFALYDEILGISAHTHTHT